MGPPVIDPPSASAPQTPRAGLPVGVVTLLFTDIEGSTRLIHRLGEGFGAVLEADPPHWLRQRFGSWLLRGETTARFESLPGGRTRLSQTFATIGLIPAISSWLFSRGSYEGSFRGELQKFAGIAEREAADAPRAD